MKPNCLDLRPYLRRRKKRRTVQGMRKSQRIFKPKGKSIDERPEIVDRRERIGDWEGDTVASKDNKVGINSLVDRRAGLLLMTKLQDKTSKGTNDVVIDRLAKLPEEMRKTLTIDNGTENSNYRGLEERLNIDVYYAHPYHSWERGTNENTKINQRLLPQEN